MFVISDQWRMTKMVKMTNKYNLRRIFHRYETAYFLISSTFFPMANSLRENFVLRTRSPVPKTEFSN